MMLADLMFLAVPVVIVLGFIAFFVVVVGTAFKVFLSVLRFLFSAPEAPTPLAPPGERHCRQRGCGQANRSGARFCARCGARLSRDWDLRA